MEEERTKVSETEDVFGQDSVELFLVVFIVIFFISERENLLQRGREKGKGNEGVREKDEKVYKEVREKEKSVREKERRREGGHVP